MRQNAFNVITDGQWGSCGKGLISTAIAARFRPDIITTTSMANAGHTAVWDDGRKFVAKALPAPAILNRWLPDYHPYIMIGPTAAFHLDRIVEEIFTCGVQSRINIHSRAGVITESHREFESRSADGTKHVASTMQGCGAFLADKVLRKQGLRLARDYPELGDWIFQNFTQFGFQATQAVALNNLLLDGTTVLHEGSQGFSLDINHGSHYPQCTSRGTTAVQNLADMGIHPHLLGDVYLVIRPYPIRVGNVIEDGEQVGYSGDGYPGQKEVSWDVIADRAGMPANHDLHNKELTTVTKRVRRVFEFSMQQVAEAVMINGATQIALNFANYIDFNCFGSNDWEQIMSCDRIKRFVLSLEDHVQIPVTVIGTGPQNNHVAFLNDN